MRTRVIQDEPKPPEAAPPVAEADEDAGEEPAAAAVEAPEQPANGATS